MHNDSKPLRLHWEAKTRCTSWEQRLLAEPEVCTSGTGSLAFEISVTQCCAWLSKPTGSHCNQLQANDTVIHLAMLPCRPVHCFLCSSCSPVAPVNTITTRPSKAVYSYFPEAMLKDSETLTQLAVLRIPVPIHKVLAGCWAWAWVFYGFLVSSKLGVTRPLPLLLMEPQRSIVRGVWNVWLVSCSWE